MGVYFFEKSLSFQVPFYALFSNSKGVLVTNRLTNELILVIVESLSQLKIQEVWMILHPDLPDL